jgi:hypothetical protein
MRKPAGGRMRPNSGFQNQSITDSEGLTSNQTDKTYFLPFFEVPSEGDETQGAAPRRRGRTRGGIDLIRRTVNNPMARRMIHRKVKSVVTGVVKNLTGSAKTRRKKREVISDGIMSSESDLRDEQAFTTTTTAPKSASKSSYALPVASVPRSSWNSCGRRSKREASFNLRSLLATFKSIQSGDLSGGLLQPFTVSQFICLPLYLPQSTDQG